MADSFHDSGGSEANASLATSFQRVLSAQPHSLLLASSPYEANLQWHSVESATTE